jgi:hypothetical protein
MSEAIAIALIGVFGSVAAAVIIGLGPRQDQLDYERKGQHGCEQPTARFGENPSSPTQHRERRLWSGTDIGLNRRYGLGWPNRGAPLQPVTVNLAS